MVLIDRHRHTYIALSQGPKFIKCVPMVSGELTTARISQEEAEDLGIEAYPTYPLERAVAVFLAHPGGISEAAARELRALVASVEA